MPATSSRRSLSLSLTEAAIAGLRSGLSPLANRIRLIPAAAAAVTEQMQEEREAAPGTAGAGSGCRVDSS